MYYVTVPAICHSKQVSLDDFLSGDFETKDMHERTDCPYTKTFKVDAVPLYVRYKTPIAMMQRTLLALLDSMSDYNVDNMRPYYRHYDIPKRSGGLRPIDEPNENLKNDLRNFAHWLSYTCNAKYHNSAYAYIPGRCTKDERDYHARQGSRWFEYLDFHNFFGSVTFDYAWNTLTHIFPFCCIVEDKGAADALYRCLQYCFLDGGLPQGTPISPMLTNILMIPFDFEISKKCYIGFSDNTYYYTRYADDICISSKYAFDPQKIENAVLDMIKTLDAPFELNCKKTHYCSYSGHNFHLGLLYNNKGDITVGYKKKDEIKAMLTNFALDTKSGKEWPLVKVQQLLGQYNYCHQQEPKYFDYVMQHLSDKFDINIKESILTILRTA